jgi:putative hydrolase of HD superfamily
LLSQPADPRDSYDTPDSSHFHPDQVDKNKLLRMAVTHDLCEALAGDITPFCDPGLISSKHEKEEQAMRSIQHVVGNPLGEELYKLWKEYENQKTVEAIYCKDIGELITKYCTRILV